MAKTIKPEKNGPLAVSDVPIMDSSWTPLEVNEAGYKLCRCGETAKPPFCDGSHNRVGFNSAKHSHVGGPRDVRVDYTKADADLVVHDNRAVCAWAGYCVKELPGVFIEADFKKGINWVKPDAAPTDKIIEMIDDCPSSALRYSLNGKAHEIENRPAAIRYSSYHRKQSDGSIELAIGPYYVQGAVPIDDAEFGQGASTEHFALCRCGGSRNKPFCDGTHIRKSREEIRASWNTPIKIGDKAGGGIVFSVNDDGVSGFVISEQDIRGECSWQTALSACTASTLNGHTDWVLASPQEWEVIAENLSKPGLAGLQGKVYWTSTPGYGPGFHRACDLVPSSKYYLRYPIWADSISYSVRVIRAFSSHG